MKLRFTLFTILFFSALVFGFTQNKMPSQTSFTLKGKVVNAADFTPIARVNIEITGKGYTTTNRAGEFAIEAKVGDELVVRSDDFKTVFYIIKDTQKITIEVEEVERERAPLGTKSRTSNQDYFKVYIDSAQYFLKKDAKRSIEYVTKALESVTGKTPSKLQNAEAFETLGDINLQWQLPDLALSNFKQSVNFSPKSSVRIKLAKAYMQNGNYQES
ncbi:MAG: sensor histidine kinase, partial [Flavobacteriaceae bacterium]